MGKCRSFSFLKVLLLSSALLLSAGCSAHAAPARSQGGLTIGFSMDTFKEERWYKDKSEFIRSAKQAGAKVLVDIADDSSAKQSSQVRDMLKKGIDVLVIIPHDADAASSAVQLAKKQGIPVISYDRLVRKANVDLYISFDNEMVGELMAKALVNASPRGNYAVINGPSSDYNTALLKKGIQKVLGPYEKNGAIKVVEQVNATDWMSDIASNAVEALLEKNIRLSGIIGGNDTLAGGIIETLSEHELSGKVPVVGQDADLSGCQRVVEGTQLMTVYKPIPELAREAVRDAILIAKGKKVTGTHSIYDGEYHVPSIYIQPVAVGKNNMYSTVIKDRFHKVNEVYLNVPKSEWPDTAK